MTSPSACTSTTTTLPTVTHRTTDCTLPLTCWWLRPSDSVVVIPLAYNQFGVTEERYICIFPCWALACFNKGSFIACDGAQLIRCWYPWAFFHFSWQHRDRRTSGNEPLWGEACLLVLVRLDELVRAQDQTAAASCPPEVFSPLSPSAPMSRCHPSLPYHWCWWCSFFYTVVLLLLVYAIFQFFIFSCLKLLLHHVPNWYNLAIVSTLPLFGMVFCLRLELINLFLSKFEAGS